MAFTFAANMLVRCREKELLSSDETLRKLSLLEKYGRYKKTILDHVRSRLEAAK
jgi:hypothetical protein